MCFHFPHKCCESSNFFTEMVIESGDSPTRKVPGCRMLLAVCREVARQLKDMQRAGVIWPLTSPWSSPVVMVRKRKGRSASVLMPFGLTNAPAVFQRLMEQVLAGLNPEQGPDFVKVYIDHVLVFSPIYTDRSPASPPTSVQPYSRGRTETEAYQVLVCRPRSRVLRPCVDSRRFEDQPCYCVCCQRIPSTHEPKESGTIPWA